MIVRKFVTLIRGSTYEAAEAITDQHAIKILRQQIRDCVSEVEAARKAVAVAIALDRQEAAQHEKLAGRIEELENRAVSALEQGRDDLAREAANAIAMLETERDSYREARKSFAAEIERLKLVIRQAEQRLQNLRNGERIAAATDKTLQLRSVTPNLGLPTLKEAEDTLERLRKRQNRADLTAQALEEMALEDSPERLNEKLARAGCGAPVATNGDAVLARLASRVKTPSEDGQDVQ